MNIHAEQVVFAANQINELVSKNHEGAIFSIDLENIETLEHGYFVHILNATFGILIPEKAKTIQMKITDSVLEANSIGFIYFLDANNEPLMEFDVCNTENLSFDEYVAVNVKAVSEMEKEDVDGEDDSVLSPEAIEDITMEAQLPFESHLTLELFNILMKHLFEINNRKAQ